MLIWARYLTINMCNNQTWALIQSSRFVGPLSSEDNWLCDPWGPCAPDPSLSKACVWGSVEEAVEVEKDGWTSPDPRRHGSKGIFPNSCSVSAKLKTVTFIVRNIIGNVISWTHLCCFFSFSEVKFSLFLTTVHVNYDTLFQVFLHC